MNSSPTKILALARLENGLPGLSQTWGKFLAEAGSVCFEYHKHAKGIELNVYGSTTTSFKVHWENEVTEQILNSWDDTDDFTEFGACGIAILLTLELTQYTVIRKACKGTGVDYWLGYKDAELPFQDAARLEVSGILAGSNSDIRARLNKKKKQTSPSDGTLPAYVVVVEFSKPLSHLVQK